MAGVLDKYMLFWKKSDVEERYICKECGVHTDLVNGLVGLAEWHAHHPNCEDGHVAIPFGEVEVAEGVPLVPVEAEPAEVLDEDPKEEEKNDEG